ncbi:hypothetical protein LJC49_08785 [Ruminococcaceae bacterium OttesenSCG-928-I18]|nr:hypothetical protein [Ruminococcaceae bacterium OttesenSCG-928-I18]
MMKWLWIERTISDGEMAAQQGESSPFNTIFVVLFAVLISYLALRIARRGGRKK